VKTYFIQAASGPVKIGKANSVRTRLSTLSCSSHEVLSILGVIEGDEEKRLHLRFKASRIRNEWFRPSESLLAFIAENASPVAPDLDDRERGKTISVQLLRDEDSAFRKLAESMNQSAANAARLILVAEVERHKETVPERVAETAVA
jgi:hypothetical protein